MARKNRGYNTYRFMDKDPVIDIARTCVQIYAATSNLKFGPAMRRLSRETGVSGNCMHNWFYGNTRRPQFATVAAVVYGAGREITFNVETAHKRFVKGSKPRFRTIKGGKAA